MFSFPKCGTKTFTLGVSWYVWSDVTCKLETKTWSYAPFWGLDLTFDMISYMVLDRLPTWWLETKKTRKVDAFWLVWPTVIDSNRASCLPLSLEVTSAMLLERHSKNMFLSHYFCGEAHKRHFFLVFPTLNHLASNGMVWNSAECFNLGLRGAERRALTIGRWIWSVASQAGLDFWQKPVR